MVFATFHWFESLQAQEKHIKNTLTKLVVFVHCILTKKNWKITKNDPQNNFKTWVRNGAGRFEALLGHLWRRSVFLTPKNVDKVLQKWPQGLNCSKNDPKGSKWSQKASQRKHLVHKMLQSCTKFYQTASKTNHQLNNNSRQWPGGLREAL